MNNLTINKKRFLTRTVCTIISVLLFVAVFFVCAPVFACAQSTDLQRITPVSGSSIEVYRVSSDKSYLDGLTVSTPTLGAVKAQLDNPASQIVAFKGETQISDNDRIGTGYILKCISSDDSTTVYEQSNVVLHGDVNGDTVIDAFDIFRTDLAVNNYVTLYDEYLLAADLDCNGKVELADYIAVKSELTAQGSVNQSAFYNTFKTVFTNTDRYLYRIGNGNTVALGKLFEQDIEGVNAVNGDNVKIKIEAIDPTTSVFGEGTNLAAGSTAKCVYTKNSSDWTASTLKFTGEGPVKLTIFEAEGFGCELCLEVVNANNATSATSATSNNVVLLNDVSTAGISISNGKTLYGNGFKVQDTRNNPSGTSGFVSITNGTANNVQFIGYEPASAVSSGTGNAGYAPSVHIGGDANLYNCYASGGRYAILIVNQPVVNLVNTTVDGGAVGNMSISGGTVNLENCTTTTSTRGGLKGLGIQIGTATGVKLNLSGTFNQYNWLAKSEVPSDYSSILSSMYNNTTYAYTYNGTKYVNMGILCAGSGNITTAQAQAIITDNTSNNYGFVSQTAYGVTGTVYTCKAAAASSDMMTTPEYSSESQDYTFPTAAFDFTNKNYIAKTSGSNLYCYYDSTTRVVNISFAKEDQSSFVWDSDILTVSKYGQSITPSVTMNGVDYTGSTISFTESGDYEVVYTYTDAKNYDINGNAFSKTYTKTVNIKVVAVEPEDNTYYAAFSYDGAAGNYSAKKVIGTDSKTYVMPDVSSTSSAIGSTTVAGQTVYYPIVTVGPTTSNGNTTYSSGKGYYFAPVFSEIHIIDYNQDTGAKQYEYSKSTTTWPHGKSATSGPNTDYFTCASGEKVYSATSPYARSTDSKWYSYNKNNLGVCYTVNEIEANNSASTHLVQYHYVSNDGTTYYYYVQYKFTAMTYKAGGCVADGTLVTMADGTKKAVENVKVGDMVMTWNFFDGCYEAQPVVVNMYHGTTAWDVLTLKFSDGTEVRTMYEHGFYDADLRRNAYINTENVSDYIGDRFVKQANDGSNTTVVLIDYSIETETAGAYTVLTAQNYNCLSDGMLSCCPEPLTSGLFEFFEIGDGMKYNAEQMQADVETYGLYTYEDLADGMTEEMFVAINAKYFKISALKYGFDRQDIIDIFNEYIYNPDNPLESY